jgi:hypothetical protein
LGRILVTAGNGALDTLDEGANAPDTVSVDRRKAGVPAYPLLGGLMVGHLLDLNCTGS